MCTLDLKCILEIKGLPETVYYIGMNREPGINFSWIFIALKLGSSISFLSGVWTPDFTMVA
jgi:hypothetical protein